MSNSKMTHQVNEGNRRGSSIFAMSSEGTNSGAAAGPYGRPAYLSNPGDDLLVDFPDNTEDRDRKSSSQYSSSKNEHYTQSSRLSRDDDDEGLVITSGTTRKDKSILNANTNSNKPKRLGEAARMQELINSKELPGGINHRPLVGGFAAAAYEAAKAHHYSGKTDDHDNEPFRDRRRY